MRYISFTLDFVFIPQYIYAFLPPKKKGFPWVPNVVGYYYYGFPLFLWFFPYVSEISFDRKKRISESTSKIHNIKEKMSFFMSP